ncbi:MAG: thioredoxin domain-containing protein [Patescibacteria group bacterium]
MKNKRYIWFVVLSLLALAGFFVIFNMFEYDVQKEEIVINQDNISDEPDELSSDPFVTKASDWYSSFIKPHNLIEDNGDVSIIAFCDFTQYECGGLWNKLKEMKDNGLPVVLAWKHFPVPTDPVSRSASKAVICASQQNAFWDFTELIFKKSSPLDESSFAAMVEYLGLNMDKFESCFNDENVVELIGQDMEDTQKLEVNTFPYVIVGSERLDKEEISGIENVILSEESR